MHWNNYTDQRSCTSQSFTYQFQILHTVGPLLSSSQFRIHKSSDLEFHIHSFRTILLIVFSETITIRMLSTTCPISGERMFAKSARIE